MSQVLELGKVSVSAIAGTKIHDMHMKDKTGMEIGMIEDMFGMDLIKGFNAKSFNDEPMTGREETKDTNQGVSDEGQSRGD